MDRDDPSRLDRHGRGHHPARRRAVRLGRRDDVDPSAGIRYFDGLVAAGRLDRTALTFRFPGSIAVFFTGTRTVQFEHGAPTAGRSATGGAIDPTGSAVTTTRVLDRTGAELTVVDARTGLTKLPSPAA